MIKVFVKDKEWHNAHKVEFEKENGDALIMFENKAVHLGNKIWVYDNEGNEIYFICEDISSEYNEYDIHQGNRTITRLKRATGMLYREIAIDAKDGKYDFLLLHGILQRDDIKVAKIKRLEKGGISIKIYEDESIEYLITMLFTILLLLMR